MHRYTHGLALLIYGGNAAKVEQDYEPIADAIEIWLAGYHDAQKADLYAILAETITPGMPLKELTEVVSSALYMNERAFTHG